jgi:diguanylate cyclase (GGDEF)-like protein
MNSLKTVVVIAADIALKSIIERDLGGTYRIVGFSNIQSSLDYIYNSIPDLLIISIDPDDTVTVGLLNGLKGDPLFGLLPVLAVLQDDFALIGWDGLFVDDYVKRSHLDSDMRARVELCIERAERVVEINPLTRLPGNIAIIKQIQNRLSTGDIFALAYADLDHFKPFNDNYGFSRGDEVLKMLGRLILNIVKTRQPCGSFVGHIGGDDFIFIAETDTAYSAAKDIIDNFDKIVPIFYDSENRTQRCIESVDREGNSKTFPIMSISIGIATNKTRPYTHYGEMTEVAAEMKKYAKRFNGSCVRTDKRKGV